MTDKHNIEKAVYNTIACAIIILAIIYIPMIALSLILGYMAGKNADTIMQSLENAVEDKTKQTTNKKENNNEEV